MPNVMPQASLWSVEPARFRAMVAALQAAGVAAFNAPASQSRPVQRRTVNGVEVVPVTGVLDKDDSAFLAWFGGTSYRAIAAQVAAAVADPEVASIVLVVNSPGGSVEGLADLGDALFEARKAKTIVAQIEGMAASAAYYLASQADKIYAGRMDLVGSIGTLLPMDDLSKLYAAAGVEALTFATGKYKAAGWPGTEITEEQRAYFQSMTDAFFADFLAAIRRGRKVEGLKDVADGRVFVAPEAKRLGLIDGLRTLDDTLTGLAKAKGTPRRARASLDILLAEANESAPSRADGDSAHTQTNTAKGS